MNSVEGKNWEQNLIEKIINTRSKTVVCVYIHIYVKYYKYIHN